MGIRIYEVGGAVRDRLLRGLGHRVETADRDWVVVGATPKDMLTQGFLPVGRDFPVFLHPKTHEEYALARTERKTAPGYHGFVFHTAPDVTLEEDLRRRDLTINAMAYDETTRTLVDPYGGQEDLRRAVLRHVSEAFQEDPVRILRTARFAARFGTFTIAPGTRALMRSMVDAGETDHLVAERVWAELARGLMEPRPDRLVEVLEDCGYWSRTYPDIPVDASVRTRLRAAAADQAPLGVRFSLLHSGVPREEKAVDALLARSKARRVPEAEARLLTLFLRKGRDAVQAHSAETFSDLLEACDVLRHPERFADFLRTLPYVVPGFNPAPIQAALARYGAVDAGAIARLSPDPKSIPERIRAARRAAVRESFP